MMKLVDDWHVIIKKAWSIRLMIMAAILSGLEFIIPLVTPATPSGWFAAGAFVISIAAFIARFIAQPRMRGLNGNQPRE